MRRLAAIAAALVLAATPASSEDPGPGYVDATANVAYLGTIPLDADAPGGRLVGKLFYVVTAKGLVIYDVSNPTLPVPVGSTALPQTVNQEREDVDTNGRILVTGQSYVGRLYVLDVSNPRLPVLLSSLPNAAGHTNSCVLDCRWVYSSDGQIVDLRDPRNPRLAGDWTGVAKVGIAHDVTEIRPGLVMTSTNPVVYLDARRDPANPTVIGTGAIPDDRYIHGNLWPRQGTDRWLLVGSETFYGCTRPREGSLMVYDTRRYPKTKRFDFVGQYSLDPGLPVDGKAMVNEACGHWFQPHPSFRDGGLVAIAWYGFGTRFVEVTKTGQIVERGYFLGGGHASSAYWITDEIVYSLDYVRGIDILRYDRKRPASDTGGGRWHPRGPDTVMRESPPERRGNPYVCPLPGQATSTAQ